MNKKVKTVFHIATKEDFIKCCHNNHYSPENFISDGFIHCTGDHNTTLQVLADYFRQVANDILIIQIETDKLTSNIKFENPAPVNGIEHNHYTEGLLFPHIYGPLNLDAVSGVAVVIKSNGSFLWPDKFEPINIILLR
jgi:uncharacterized protein (DUF952 family)